METRKDKNPAAVALGRLGGRVRVPKGFARFDAARLAEASRLGVAARKRREMAVIHIQAQEIPMSAQAQQAKLTAVPTIASAPQAAASRVWETLAAELRERFGKFLATANFGDLYLMNNALQHHDGANNGPASENPALPEAFAILLGYGDDPWEDIPS
jgi:hypothetical protein